MKELDGKKGKEVEGKKGNELEGKLMIGIWKGTCERVGEKGEGGVKEEEEEERRQR